MYYLKAWKQFEIVAIFHEIKIKQGFVRTYTIAHGLLLRSFRRFCLLLIC
jgi:hypothetical protein